MAVNSPNSPRQKMINLMYLVFIAMLALNVPSEVLDGFELVEESLVRSVESSTSKNNLIFSDLEAYHTSNPEKTKVWYDLAEQVKIKSDSLFNYTEKLKIRIVKEADGEKGDPKNLKNQADLNASNEVMFESGENNGKKLKENISSYRKFVTSLVSDTAKKHIIENNLSTEPSKKAKRDKQSWEESMFMQMPLAAAVTLLTKIQNDIRYAEGEVLSELVKNIDLRDLRVNKVSAFVIPQSQIVMKGGSYVADIGLAAQDSTKRPKIFVNGKFLPDEFNGRFTVGAGSVGSFPVKGYVEMAQGDGTVLKREFSTEYFVQEQSVSIEAAYMNVLYAGIPNQITFAVAGVVSQSVEVKMTNGTITRTGNTWSAVPAKVGTDVVFTVLVKTSDGRTQEFAKKTFRVRRLPDPMAYIGYEDANGNPAKFQKSGRLSKAVLVSANELKAAIDDGILDIQFTVIRFETLIFDSMGNTVRDASDGPRFSSSQKERIRNLTRGKPLFIRGIIARGPDGVEREVSMLEITVN